MASTSGPPSIAPNASVKALPGSGPSATLWATGLLLATFCVGVFLLTPRLLASKEWVIPPRPKPGRKPKKPQAHTDSSSTPAARVSLPHDRRQSPDPSPGARSEVFREVRSAPHHLSHLGTVAY